MSAQPMEYYRLRTPTWSKRIGQGDPPDAMIIQQDEHTYRIPWGTEVRASDSCDPEGQVANLEHDPPLVRCRVIDRFPDQFEYIPETTE